MVAFASAELLIALRTTTMERDPPAAHATPTWLPQPASASIGGLPHTAAAHRGRIRPPRTVGFGGVHGAQRRAWTRGQQRGGDQPTTTDRPSPHMPVFTDAGPTQTAGGSPSPHTNSGRIESGFNPAV